MRRFYAALLGDAGLSILLISLLIILFVIFPFLHLGLPARLALSIGLSVVLVSGSFSMRTRPRHALLTLSLAGVAFWTRWLGHVSADARLLTAFHVSMILFLGWLAATVLAKTVRPGRITFHRLQGAIVVYLLMGWIWGYAYSLLELHQPGSFRLAESTATAESSRDTTGPAETEGSIHELTYFSFVTLTTLGYGDVAPLSPAARSLAVLEALTGQLFLVILISRLVSLQVADDSK